MRLMGLEEWKWRVDEMIQNGFRSKDRVACCVCLLVCMYPADVRGLKTTGIK
jgi:hypothetical protein